jgi:hypothetical protein
VGGVTTPTYFDSAIVDLWNTRIESPLEDTFVEIEEVFAPLCKRAVRMRNSAGAWNNNGVVNSRFTSTVMTSAAAFELGVVNPIIEDCHFASGRLDKSGDGGINPRVRRNFWGQDFPGADRTGLVFSGRFVGNESPSLLLSLPLNLRRGFTEVAKTVTTANTPVFERVYPAGSLIDSDTLNFSFSGVTELTGQKNIRVVFANQTIASISTSANGAFVISGRILITSLTSISIYSEISGVGAATFVSGALDLDGFSEYSSLFRLECWMVNAGSDDAKVRFRDQSLTLTRIGYNN